MQPYGYAREAERFQNLSTLPCDGSYERTGLVLPLGRLSNTAERSRTLWVYNFTRRSLDPPKAEAYIKEPNT